MLDMTADSDRISHISERVIGCAFAVSNGPGGGFLEKVYKNALVHELRKARLVLAHNLNSVT